MVSFCMTQRPTLIILFSEPLSKRSPTLRRQTRVPHGVAASDASRTLRQRSLQRARRTPGLWRRRPCYAVAAAADTSVHVRWTPAWRRRRPARQAGSEGSHSRARLSRSDICPVHSDRSVPRRLVLSNASVGYLGRDVCEVVTHAAALAVVFRMPRPRRRYFRGPCPFASLFFFSLFTDCTSIASRGEKKQKKKNNPRGLAGTAK